MAAFGSQAAAGATSGLEPPDKETYLRLYRGGLCP
jgi:hypothetical protein